ncbi:MAG: Uma2 family endonuclease [Hormoscilla sp. SP12CHS1]|nr:Uma2 family endonuclease [Hormoscilla sp. SP12CHS1]
MSYSNIDKPRLYAAMGVPELWRYNGEVLRIYQLQDVRYVEVENSPTFPNWGKRSES